MKILNLLIPMALVAIGVGCQSGETRASYRTTTTTQTVQTTASQQNAPPSMVQQELEPITVEQIITDKATYTIQSIPDNRLTPTSREGDSATHVYSSNIIAVYMHTNGVTPANNSQPQNK